MTRSTVRRISGFLAVASLATFFVAAPAGFSRADGLNFGFFGGGAKPQAYTEEIFIVSTRKSDSQPTELAPGGKARFALQYVSIPPGHKPGQIERPAFGGPNPDQHFTVVSTSELDDDEFGQQLAAHLSGRVGSNRDVLIYVHGFNNSTDDARMRLVQLAYDANFGGVPILFTWPSKAALLAYGADKESATASRDAYLNLLETVAETPGVGKIHILAHSMGTWLTMETLREEALSGSADLHGKLGQVMLASPDIDLTVFKQQLKRLDPSHFSVYVSKDDRALQVSATLQGDRRLGSLDPSSDRDRELIEKLGVGVYDLSDLASNLIGHDNYGDAPQVVRQIGQKIGKARAEDAEQQSVIDAGADRSARPAPGAIDRQDLAAPAPVAAAPAAQ